MYLSPADNCEGTSPILSAWGQSAGYQHGKRVSRTSFNPLRLHVSTPQPFNTTIILPCHVLDRLRLVPRRNPKEQHLSQ